MTSAQRRPITRNRELLACTECRRRKLKCDRHTPCTACAKRGDEASCTYQRCASGVERERERRLQAEARLEHLEQLVQQLSQHGGKPDSHQVAEQRLNHEESEMGHEASASHKEPIFNGSTHWSAMLEDIEELRSVIVPCEAVTIDDDILEYEENIGASLILGSVVPLPLQQMLVQYLPSRQEADRLTAAYFRNRGVSAPFIHASHFRRLYQDFWRDPSRAPVLWTSMFFSICHIATNTLSLGKEKAEHDDRYNVASAHCLALGEYFRPMRFSVESLLLFVQARCLTSLSMSPDSGLLLGLLIRLATRMGYHRDPDMFPLSAFDKEMRRRTWSLCMQLDLLTSFQLGLPSNIQFPTWDTRPPTNLDDSDFDEDTKELPPARPDSEVTGILFYVAKHRLMAVFEKILRHNLSTGANDSAIVDELDTEIRKVYLAFPENLLPRPMADSVVDSPSLIVTRLCVFFVYQKCLCVLHRPYVTRGRVYSSQICCDAASDIVRCFNDTYEEFLPGGQLETERWFMSNITWHDYLFGVVALCAILCSRSQFTTPPDVQFAELIQLLQRAQSICVEQSTRSKESGRVQKVVKATLLHYASLESHNHGAAVSEFGLVTSSLDLPPINWPFAGDQTRADDSVPHSLQELQPEQMEPSWTESDIMPMPMDDPSWAYLEQFLNLSDDDFGPIGF